jgi:hypothetical protein
MGICINTFKFLKKVLETKDNDFPNFRNIYYFHVKSSIICLFIRGPPKKPNRKEIIH